MARRDRNDPGQLYIDWTNIHAGQPAAPEAPVSANLLPNPPASAAPIAEGQATQSPPALVQRLRWDFRESFPEPTPEAMDAGILAEDDLDPANIRSLHEEHAREALAALRSLDNVLDARRRGVDPKTGQPPRTKADRENLQDFLQHEADRFQRWWKTLMDTYESAFGAEAADAFAKAIRAWHAGIEVVAECPTLASSPREPVAISEETSAAAAIQPAQLFPDTPKPHRHRISTRLPVPRPLPGAVAAGHFGHDAHGPIRPCADEVRAITQHHAEKIIELLDGLRQVETRLSQRSDLPRLNHDREQLTGRIQSALAAYAEDFGQPAADQLEAYARRQSQQDSGRGRRR